MMEDIEEPFCAAVRAGDVEAVSALLASEPRPPVNECYVGEGQTALMWAASEGNMALVRVLVESGEANIEDQGPSNGLLLTPLCLASAKGHYDVVDYLLGRGARFSVKDRDGRTPLIHAAISGHEATVRRLLAADPHAVTDATDEGGMCALMHACKEGHANIARVLMLENGATVRSIPSSFYRRDPEAGLSTECVAVLKEAMKCFEGLVNSVVEGNLAQVIQLLDQAPGLLRINEPTSNSTVLALAASEGQVDIVRHLIRRVSKEGRERYINGTRRREGRDTESRVTALMEACRTGKGEVVALLLAEGADAAVIGSEGENAVKLAYQGGHWDILTQLWRSITSRKTPYRAVGSEALYHCCESGCLDLVKMLVYDGMEFCENGLRSFRIFSPRSPFRADCFEFMKVVRGNVEALGQACARGNLTEASELLRVHPYLLHMGAVGTGRTALMEAAANDRVDVLRMLLEHDSYTAASVAAMCDPYRNREGPSFIPPIDFKDAKQHSALSLASASGFLGAVKLLLGKGADPCPFDPVEGSRFIMLDTADALRAACAGGNLPVVELLFQLSLYSEGMGRYFIAACSSGHEEVVHLVGAHMPDTPHPIEWSRALFEASKHGNVSLVRRVMERQHSDPNAAVALLNERFKMAGERGGEAMVKLFLEEGADVVLYDTLLPHRSVLEDELEKRERLVNAAEEGDLKALKGLLGDEGDKKKVLRGRNGQGSTPLTAAAYHSEVEVAEYLVQRGAEPDYADKSGWTPLMWAAQDGDVEMIHCLCEAGAQPWYTTWKDDESQGTAVMFANGDLEAVTALLSYAPTGPNQRAVDALREACYRGEMALFRKLVSLCSLSAHSVVRCLEAAVCWDNLPVIMELLLIMMEKTPRSITFDMIMEEAAALAATCRVMDDDSEPPDPRDRVSDQAYTMIELAVREDLYLLHKARTISDANSPQATPPPCLASRAQPQHQPLPRVTVTVPAGITGGRPHDQGLEETPMEVLQVVVQFVVRDLKVDLYIELSHMLMPVKGW